MGTGNYSIGNTTILNTPSAASDCITVSYFNTNGKAQGPQGFVGVQGSNGATGSSGTSGAQGIAGSQGLTGTTGSAGVQGSIGVMGPQGLTSRAVIPTAGGSTFSSTSLGGISALSLTLNSSQTYIFQISLITVTATAASGGIQVDLGGGSCTATTVSWGATFFDTAATQGSSSATGAQAQTSNITSLTTVATHNSSASQNTILVLISGVITVASGGTFFPRAAQATTNATATQVLQDSWIKMA